VSSIIIEEYTSGERSKEVHVHIGGKENKKIVTYIKIQHVGSYNSKKPSKAFQLHSTRDH
jgi:hypothetical protein